MRRTFARRPNRSGRPMLLSTTDDSQTKNQHPTVWTDDYTIRDHRRQRSDAKPQQES